MRLKNQLLVPLSICLLVTAAFLYGCATTGTEQTVKTSNSIQEVDSEIRNMMARIDATSNSLDSLLKAGLPELKIYFDIYSDNLVKFEKQGKLVIKRAAEMKVQSKEYFAEWEKQGNTYTNPRIREFSDERRNKLADIYAQVPAAGEGIEAAYLDYLADLKEIQMYLSNDLTPKGVEAIATVAQKAIQHLDALKTSLRPVLSALDEIRFELYQEMK